jgi:hypothetical protein
MRSAAVLALVLGGMLFASLASAADPVSPRGSTSSKSTKGETKGRRVVYVRIQKGIMTSYVRVEFDEPLATEAPSANKLPDVGPEKNP